MNKMYFYTYIYVDYCTQRAEVPSRDLHVATTAAMMRRSAFDSLQVDDAPLS